MTDYFNIDSATKYSELYSKDVQEREFIKYSRSNYSEAFYLRNLLHRTDGPAIIEYYKNGKIERVEYYENDEIHRIDGPARICYHENDNLGHVEYRIKNKLHRTDGPAYISYHKNGRIQYQNYYINGELL